MDAVRFEMKGIRFSPRGEMFEERRCARRCLEEVEAVELEARGNKDLKIEKIRDEICEKELYWKTSI